jgi:predicted Zn-dependent protease
VKKEVFDLAAAAIQTAKSAGADACCVNISSERSVEVSYRERKPETIKEASKRNLQIELYVAGRYSSQGTSDLRPDALKRFIAEAVSDQAPGRDRFDRWIKYYRGVRIATSTSSMQDTKLKPEDQHDIAKAIGATSLKRAARGGIRHLGRRGWPYQGLLMSSNGFRGPANRRTTRWFRRSRSRTRAIGGRAATATLSA